NRAHRAARRRDDGGAAQRMAGAADQGGHLQSRRGGLNPDVEQLFDDANGDLALGELEAAVEKYRRCVELEPEFFDGWHALGMALMKTGRYPEAIEAGQKSVDLHPNDQLAW